MWARMRLIVIRHGNAAAKRTWQGPDDDRPLTRTGEDQAQALVRRVRRYQPTRVISSPSLRCRQTVAPLAAAGGLEVEDSPALARTAGAGAAEWVTQLVAASEEATTVVLCTHREVLVELLPALSRPSGVRLGHKPPGAKGGRWQLVFRAQKLRSVKYIRPLH